MHIQSCLSPKLIRDRKGEKMYVPCGKCAACLRSRSFRWVQRLDAERYNNKYAVFFTLTYADEHLPRVQVLDNHLVDVDHVLTPPDTKGICVDMDDIKNRVYSDSESPDIVWSKDIDWLHRVGCLPVVSPYHLSKFIKRLRVNLSRLYAKSDSPKKVDKVVDTTFRYYAIGEYGSTLLRPHYHGVLFFNSEFFAEFVQTIIRKSWQFGITDCSFVSATNSSYVASYLNCISHLPSFYRYRKFRPFFLCSKFPPIGTSKTQSDMLRKFFFDASPLFTVFNHKQSKFDVVPLWRCYRDRLYPRLTLFNEISHVDRVTLYRLSEAKSLETFQDFIEYVLGYKGYIPSLIYDYVNHLKSTADDWESAIRRWYYISRRVCQQALIFGISVSDYVRQIDLFYQNCEKLKLKQQYELEIDFSEHDKLSELVGLDLLFILPYLDLDITNVSPSELDYLSSYGIDVVKFFSDDDNIRSSYQSSILPPTSRDFLEFKIDSELFVKNASKTRVKNDYLAKHPELIKFIY